jgi:seryl-tRNA synthetase
LRSKSSEGDLEARLKAEFEHELTIKLDKAKRNYDYEIEQIQSDNENKIKRATNELNIQLSDLQITIDQLKQANKKLQSDFELQLDDKSNAEGGLKDKIGDLNTRISELIRENERIKAELNAKMLEQIQSVDEKYKEILSNTEKKYEDKIE